MHEYSLAQALIEHVGENEGKLVAIVAGAVGFALGLTSSRSASGRAC